MKIRLEKKNRISTDFVQMEIDGHLLKIQSGKPRAKKTFPMLSLLALKTGMQRKML